MNLLGNTSLTEKILVRFVEEIKENDAMLKALRELAFVAQTEIGFETKDLEAETEEEKYCYKAMYYFIRKKPDSKTGELVNPVFGNPRSETMKRVAVGMMNSDVRKFFNKL